LFNLKGTSPSCVHAALAIVLLLLCTWLLITELKYCDMHIMQFLNVIVKQIFAGREITSKSRTLLASVCEIFFHRFTCRMAGRRVEHVCVERPKVIIILLCKFVCLADDIKRIKFYCYNSSSFGTVMCKRFHRATRKQGCQEHCYEGRLTARWLVCVFDSFYVRVNTMTAL